MTQRLFARERQVSSIVFGSGSRRMLVYLLFVTLDVSMRHAWLGSRARIAAATLLTYP